MNKENNIIRNKPRRKYTKRKNRKAKINSIKYFFKRFFIIAILIIFVSSIVYIVVQNITLRMKNSSLYTIYSTYKNMYEEANDVSVVEYNYWIEEYKNLRKDYQELLKYLGEEDLNYKIYTVTGYSANDMENQGTTNTTSIKFKLDAQYMDYIGIVAVDPEIIPYGSYVFVRANWGDDEYIYEKMFIAGDCGGDIKGQRLDIYFESKTEALNFGLQACLVKVIVNKNEYTNE